jgi:hypothetical protein
MSYAMTLLFALLALLPFIVVAGRAHSRHLDRMEATILALSNLHRSLALGTRRRRSGETVITADRTESAIGLRSHQRAFDNQSNRRKRYGRGVRAKAGHAPQVPAC